MDQHDRPYRCRNPDCKVLEGFTYPGGLYRHDKEVHGKDNGANSGFTCDYPDCQRRDKKFTRKENLKDHIRRRHGRDQLLQRSAKMRERNDGDDVLGTEIPASGCPTFGVEIDPAAQLSRYRHVTTISDISNFDHLSGTGARLQEENARLREEIALLQEIAHEPTGKRKRDAIES